MLARYFGFVEDPFGATPDPRYLYSSRTHREALASLHYAFYSNRGFTALIAPPGMGKTTLLFEFLRHVRETARTAFLFNSQCDPTDLLRNILTEVGLTPQDSLGSMLQQLNSELVETARSGRRFVVVVDEAQNLSEPALETLRLLTNFETSRAKLMQIVLSGQPQLGDALLRPGLVQLRQRISTFCRLEPLVPDETVAYIVHRLRVAGYTGPSLFTADALARIGEASEGIPRNINTLCFNALSLSCGLKKKQVDQEVLDEVLRDLQPAPQQAREAEEESPAIYIGTERAEERERDTRMSRMRVPVLAALVLLVVCGAFWAADVFSAGHGRAEQTALPGPPAPAAGSLPVRPAENPAPPAVDPVPAAADQVPAAAAPVPLAENSVGPADKARDSDAIEVTVDPQQSVSGISVSTLGTFDDQLLRQIKELNPGLQNPDLIHPGEKLLLPRLHRSASQK
jgi:general secretion pathway protein A